MCPCRTLSATALIGDQMEFTENELQHVNSYVRHDESYSGRSSQWRVLEKMVSGGASAVGLPGGILVTRQSAQEEPTLLSTQAAIGRLAAVRSAATHLGKALMLVACTHAKAAQTLTFDDDRRDWRCLSGQRTQDGSYVYCGGMGAAIDRSLAYAPHADVLCYRASSFEITEALRFSHEVTRRFPDKQCAFCLDPRVDELARPALDISATQQKVLRAGFSYFLFHQFGSIVFRGFPADTPWAVVEDRAEVSALEDASPGAWDRSAFDSRRCRKR